MADRQRWLWAAWRLVNRNRWTLFGGFAALTIAGNAVTAWILFYNDPKQRNAAFARWAQAPAACRDAIVEDLDFLIKEFYDEG